jgi:hypothetical protein
MPTPASSHRHAGPVGTLRRVGQMLCGWWPPPRPAPPTRQVQLLALADILDEAVAAQPAADRAVAACGAPGLLPVSALKETAAQITIYHHLILRLRALRLASDLLPLGERASRLLAHHEWILNQALGLVRAPGCDARSQTARQHLNGLGDTAHDLRVLREEVRGLADRACGEAERPCGEGAQQ